MRRPRVMKVIIAGSRVPMRIRNSRQLVLDWYRDHYALVQEAVDLAKKTVTMDVDEVICGMASGFDALGMLWAKQHKIPVREFPAKWTNERGRFDRLAGFNRNISMAEYADGLIAIWDGISPGTGHMIKEMDYRNKPYYVHKFKHTT